jgi:hypothetical protein
MQLVSLDHIRPARSALPAAATVLAHEAELVWLQPCGIDLPWLRECFPFGNGSGADGWAPANWAHAKTFRKPLWYPDDYTFAVTFAVNGHPCREFRCSQRSLDAYAAAAASGDGTCPLEAVIPSSIAIGKPSTAAHLEIMRNVIGLQGPL